MDTNSWSISNLGHVLFYLLQITMKNWKHLYLLDWNCPTKLLLLLFKHVDKILNYIAFRSKIIDSRFESKNYIAFISKIIDSRFKNCLPLVISLTNYEKGLPMIRVGRDKKFLLVVGGCTPDNQQEPEPLVCEAIIPKKDLRAWNLT